MGSNLCAVVGFRHAMVVDDDRRVADEENWRGKDGVSERGLGKQSNGSTATNTFLVFFCLIILTIVPFFIFSGTSSYTSIDE